MNIDELVKSSKSRHACENRHPATLQHGEITGLGTKFDVVL